MKVLLVILSLIVAMLQELYSIPAQFRNLKDFDHE
jgi:hypothetical protein